MAPPAAAAPTTVPAPARPTATYATPGGMVTVSCDGLLISLLAAIPVNGYSVQVRVNGPVNVDIAFVGGGQQHTVKAVCFGQPIRYYDRVPSRPGSARSS